MDNKIKILRQARGIKQVDLAKHLQVSQGTLSYWEQGKYDIDNSSLSKLADYFNVSTDYLLGRTENPAPPSDKIPEDFLFAASGEPGEFTDDQKQDILNFARFIKEQGKNKEDK